MPESAVCAVARGRGATCLDVDGWTVVDAYGDARDEYRALREDAAIVDLAFRHRLRATGSDRITFLQGMLSNDVARLGPGEGCPALLLNEQGRVVADLMVLARDDALVLDALAPAIVAASAALERFIVADDVELAPLAGSDHAFGVYGPRAADALVSLGVGRDAVPTDDYAHRPARIGDVELLVARVPAPGVGGFMCVAAADQAVACWSRAVNAGVSAAGQRAFDVFRIESGVPWYGRDVGPDTIALEAPPLEPAVSFRKGCYLGQEVMERVSARGHVNRKLVGLELDGAEAPAAGTRLFAAERDVGFVTSACWSWRLERPIALGYVRREHLGPGTNLAVGAADAARVAIVTALPFR